MLSPGDASIGVPPGAAGKDASVGRRDHADATSLPRVRVRWTGVRRMEPGDPFVQKLAATTLAGHINNAVRGAMPAKTNSSSIDSSSATDATPLLPYPMTNKLFFMEKEHSDTPFIVRVTNNCVAFLHRGTHIVERSFVFPDRVIDAVMTHFDPTASRASFEYSSGFASADSLGDEGRGAASSSRKKRARGKGLELRPEPHLCVLVRSDCVNIYTPSGEVYEAALPFQANRLFAMESGLLMQRSPAAQPSVSSRKSDTPNSTLYVDKEFSKRPRFFTLAHPLDEIKPVALAAAGSTTTAATGKPARSRLQHHSSAPPPAFLCDPALEIVTFCVPLSLLVCFHKRDRRFRVYRLRGFPAIGSQRVAPVQVVDSATWQKHREKEADREDKVTIVPDWIAKTLWVSPDNARSSTLRLPSSSTSSWRSAFLASDLDLAPLLCLMDKQTEVLMLKRIDSLSSGETALNRDSSGAHEDMQTIRCRDALPISTDSEQPAAGGCVSGLAADIPNDIVVLTNEGTLRLYRGDHPICELAHPSAEQDASARSSWPPTTEIRMSDNALCFEICGHDVANFPEMLHRSRHPLRVFHSPLLEKAFEVLGSVLPPRLTLALRAEVASLLQKRRADAEQDSASENEWAVFHGCILSLLDKGDNFEQSGGNGEVSAEPETTATSAFETLCQTGYHQTYQFGNPMLFLRMDSHAGQQAACGKSIASGSPPMVPPCKSLIQSHAAKIFAGLHLLYEDLKLSVTSSHMCLQLSTLVLEMSIVLGLEAYCAYYQQENCISLRSKANPASTCTKTRAVESALFPDWENSCVPDIFRWIHLKIRGSSGLTVPEESFPTLASVAGLEHSLKKRPPQTQETPLWRTAAVRHIYDLVFPKRPQLSPVDSQDHDRQLHESTASLMAYLTQEAFGVRLNLRDLPFAIQFPIAETISKFRHAPPPFVTEDICEFIGREDLAGVVASRINLYSSDAAHNPHGNQLPKESPDLQYRDDDKAHEVSDGLEELILSSRQLFPVDQRMKEVARLIRSNRPLCLKLEKTSDVSDQDYVLQQQARLLLLCKRSMALPVARGMITLGSFDLNMAQSHAWQLRVPELPLAGRTPPTNATVSLDVSGYAKELTFWPQFHNGCAAGLRLPARDLSNVVNRYWIKYHRPSVAEHQARNAQRNNGQAPSPEAAKRSLEEGFAAHAGLLLGLGLRGHLKCLSMADVYNYLSLSNEFVTVAILLGMATTAAHCRQRRKLQSEATKAHGFSRNASVLDSSPAPPSADAGADAGLTDVALEDDTFMPGSSKAPSKTPLVGSGLELTLERSVSKMLCLHIPSLLPPPFAEFSVPASTQTAALLGLGVLYQATGHRLMTELLLTEIARSPSSAQFVSSNSNSGLSTASFDQLEGYALAAGLALGLVVLGRGQTKSGDPGLADMKLEEKLYKYIVGGAQQFGDANAVGGCLYRGRKWNAFGQSGSTGGAGSGPSGSTSASVSGREPKSHQDRGLRGEHVNVGVTACGSALALAFMYMQTGNKSIAAQLAVPDTLILLDYVRPDLLMVRTLAKNLVLWDSVIPTVEWVEEVEVPAQLMSAYTALQVAPAADRDVEAYSVRADAQSICEAYANIIAGACFSIGLRFAGTRDAQARKTLRKYIIHFREMRSRAAVSRVGGSNAIVAATERVTIERCLAGCAQALALVDAGTGNVETLTLLRSVNLRQRVDPELTYGNHMALSMAIGLLFVGGGRATVSRSKEAVASLVISLFPMYPMNTADNKHHLQAFRHLYVLAVDTSRLLETIDVNSGANCSVQVRLQLRGHANHLHSEKSKWQTLQSPCLLPDLNSIKRIVISGDEFYPVEIVMSAKQSKAPANVERQQTMTANALRLELLRDKNVILLKRRKRNGSISGSLAGITNELSQLHHLTGDRHDAKDKDDHLMLAFRSYFLRDTDPSGVDEETSSFGNWWHNQSQQLVAHHVHEEASSLLSLYLNSLYALFRLQHAPLRSITGLRNLKLYTDYCETRRRRRDNVHGQEEVNPFMPQDHDGDFVVWLKHQTEEALRTRWRKGSTAITSSSSAQTRMLDAKREPATFEDNFLLNALTTYFAAPSTIVLQSPKGWQAKFQQLLSASSSSNATHDDHQFQLHAFLRQDQLTEQEKAFWLQVVSFFLFAG